MQRDGSLTRTGEQINNELAFSPPHARNPREEMTDSTTGNSGPTIRTETMAQLLLSQGHWQQARQIYQELYQQDPKKHGRYQKKISEIKQFFAPDTANSTGDSATRERTHRQIRHLKKLLQRLEKAASPKSDTTTGKF